MHHLHYIFIIATALVSSFLLLTTSLSSSSVVALPSTRTHQQKPSHNDNVLDAFYETDECMKEQMAKKSEIFDELMKEKTEAFWEHERFLKRRGWDSDAHRGKDGTNDENGENVPLPPSEKKKILEGEVNVEHRQMSPEERRMRHMHSLREDEIEDAKKDGIERWNFLKSLSAVDRKSNHDDDLENEKLKKDIQSYSEALRQATKRYYQEVFSSSAASSHHNNHDRQKNYHVKSLSDYVSWIDVLLVIGFVGVIAWKMIVANRGGKYF